MGDCALAGFLKVCAWTVMVSATSQARRAPKQPSCSLKGLTNLTRSEVAESLALFVSNIRSDTHPIQTGIIKYE